MPPSPATLSRKSDPLEANGEGTSSSDEEREDGKAVVNANEEPNTQGTFQKEVTNTDLFRGHLNGPNHCCSSNEDDLAVTENAVPTIYFSHTVEPKRVCMMGIFELAI